MRERKNWPEKEFESVKLTMILHTKQLNSPLPALSGVTNIFIYGSRRWAQSLTHRTDNRKVIKRQRANINDEKYQIGNKFP